MKKKLCALLFGLCVFSITACGSKETLDNSNNASTFSQEVEIMENHDDTADSEAKQTELENLDEVVALDIESTVASIREEYEKLLTEIDTYDKFIENTDKMESFYKWICEENKLLCIRMREYSIIYAREITDSDKSTDEKYDDLEELYDCIYDDAGDDIYDEIYDDFFDDMYDDFYDGILDDAYDNDVPYAEWSGARSGEYRRWSGARSDVYGEWSDFRSDVYRFWSVMRSALWKDDIEKTEKEIENFEKDIEKIKNKSIKSDTQIADREESSDSVSEDVESEDSNTNDELVDGVRPKFKEAMDSYEAFYDEYCEIIKKYTANPTDMELLTSYLDILAKSVEMTEKFEAWEDDEMNDAELRYYMDVTNRITQKLLELYE